jgi:hypothetical protein
MNAAGEHVPNLWSAGRTGASYSMDGTGPPRGGAWRASRGGHLGSRAQRARPLF